MRSAVFLLMFAVSLVAWECTAQTAQQTGELIKDQQQPGGTGITTTTAQQAPASEQLPAKVPEPDPALVSEEVPEKVEVSPKEPQSHGSAEGTDVDEIKTIKDAPSTPKLEPEKPHAGQQNNEKDQLQQQGHSQNSDPDRTKVGVPTEMRTGGDIQLAPKTPPSSTGGHVTQNAQDKTQKTPGSPPKPPTDRQASPSSTLGRNVNTQTPTNTIIRQAASHPPEQDQHHARQQPQTSPAGKVVPPNTLPQDKKITPPPSQSVGHEKTKAGSSGGVQSQAPAQTLASSKTKKTVNSTSTPVTPGTPADKNSISLKKPITTTTPPPDSAASPINTTIGDNEANQMQTSVTSTAEPVKEISSLPANTSEKLSKALQSLDNKDSSFGSSALFALAALSILVVMAVAPAF